QTVLVAAGDAGATDCAPESNLVAVNALAASPNSVAVGGTALDPLFDGRTFAATGYGGEEAWNDTGGGGGGGGGPGVSAPPAPPRVGRLPRRAPPPPPLPAAPP